jgi:hypothetical protein
VKEEKGEKLNHITAAQSTSYRYLVTSDRDEGGITYIEN